ncbi:MAG: tetratricopeptide repeat protein [Gemmatimonadota bacterium]
MASSPRIDELRKKFEENPRRYFAPLANEYRKAGEIEQAIAICREYLPQQPGHMSGHIVFGQALFEAKQLDEAKTVFETALSLDPENLIALKHLGDITLAAGDKEAAKGWFKRVLDADPRNEETQALLAQIEGTAKPAAAPIATPATPPAATPTSKTMPMPAAKPAPASSAPTVVMQAMRPLPKLGATHVPAAAAAPAAAPPAPTPAAAPIPSLSTAATVPLQVPAASATAATEEIKLEGLTHGADSTSKVVAGSTTVAATLIMETPHGMSPVGKGDAPEVVPTVGLEATAVGTNEAPMESFSLDGLETTSLAPPPPAPTPAVDVGALDLDFGTTAPPAVTPPPAAVEAVAAPEIELDIPSAPPPAPVVSPAPGATDALPMIDLDFGAPTVAADDSGLVELDIGFAPPPATPEPEVPAAPTEIPAPALSIAAAAPVELEVETPAPAPDSGPFVTETMAELYLQQGHRDEALRVYRALLEQRPGDAKIEGKIAELTGAPTEPPAPMLAAEALPVAPVLPPADGPTIRAVLMLIAMRRPGYRPEPADTNGAHAEVAAPAEPLSRQGADSLGALWNDAPPALEEESAALVLSAAFADLDGAARGNGLDLSAAAAAATAAQAAQAAAMSGGPPAAPSSFSFDKFFSQRVTAEYAAQSGKAGVSGAPVESKDDVAQFTKWLEGLKQR